MARHGPGNYFAHIMRAFFDPVYGRENSLALPEQVKPATRFPLAEEQRPHDSSENNAMINFSGGSYIKPSKANPFENTAIIAEGSQNKPKDPYQGYSKYQRYSLRGMPSNFYNLFKNANIARGIYKIESVVKALEKRAKRYFSKLYRPNKKTAGDESKTRNPPYGQTIAASYSSGKEKGYGQENITYESPGMPQQPQISYPKGIPTSYGSRAGINNDPYGTNDTAKSYNAKEILSWPTLDEFMKWQEIKAKQEGSSPLEQTVNLSFSRN